jgi:hypothetical protein
MTDMERAALRGRLADKKEAAQKLRYLIEVDCRTIRTGLNTILIRVEDLEIPLLAQQMESLVWKWGELQGILAELSRLEGALK